jgi:UDP-glucose 4-epimerase
VNPNLKTIFITGASGYIGSNLAASFSSDEVNLVLIDINEFPEVENSSRNIVYEFGDLLDSDFIDCLALKYQGVRRESVLIHLAASKSVAESTEFPEKYLVGNVNATKNVLLLLNRIKIKNIIFTSTAAVYGNQAFKGKISEKSSTNPMSPYAVSKLECEKLIEDTRVETMRFAILRLFNVVGAISPNYVEEDGANLIPTILRNFSKKLPTFIYGSDYPTKDGTCERDYVDVRDLITAIKKCVKILPHKEVGTLNLGTGNPHTVLDVVNSIEKSIGKIEIRFGDARLGDPSSVIADITEASLTLHWRPVYDLDSSVNSMTSHLKPH